ncbi:MAG TPA: hypothetical protein VGU25_16440 [Acidobacteriaceae bacterium]|nr:hypothetical protein [Acidobacteriaceae bacterium]
MRKEDLAFASATYSRLGTFDQGIHALPGISTKDTRRTLVFQIVESVRRIRFVQQVSQRPIAASRKDPSSAYFDPVRAAILYHATGDLEEACWLVFLFVHFGKNLKSGYQLIADVYGSLGQGKTWTWKRVSDDPLEFRHWLDKHQSDLKSQGNKHRGFGNHRKYQSLHAWKQTGTGEAVQSYVTWVKSAGGHKSLFASAVKKAGGNAELAFAELYRAMNAVRSFGRTAKFDYLAMIGKIGLAAILPDSVHFVGATGPVSGAKLLFTGNTDTKMSNKRLQELSDLLSNHLKVDKQVIEDSLCNWQKSPTEPVSFRG